MFDLPLHPIVVHFPIIPAHCSPCWPSDCGGRSRKRHGRPGSWALISAVALVYSLSTVVAVQLGEADEEKVSRKSFPKE